MDISKGGFGRMDYKGRVKKGRITATPCDPRALSILKRLLKEATNGRKRRRKKVVDE